MADQNAGRPPQHQDEQPGHEGPMQPQPETQPRGARGAGKLEGKVALITGGDSGIGRAVAVAFAREGADIAIVYLDEHEDAEFTRRQVEGYGTRCICISGDVGSEDFCRDAVNRAVRELGRLDVLVNNAAEQHPQDDLQKISEEQLARTFRTNIFGQFFMTKAALPHLRAGSSIVNTTSITAYQGNPRLLDYSSTKGAIVSFTRALSNLLVSKGVRVNAVAPGPIWTPLIPATFPAEAVEKFGQDTPMGRAGQPNELAPAYVFLASEVDSSYISGQVIHVNGGQVVES
ncbi:MAG TPA: SDR family oxidoreductase [Chloroflexota bacterium]|nr:SDR family oxidoreductase [Chloroflexota bacterium]